jgi:hypothetical protein
MWHHHRLVTGLGVGVHLTLSISLLLAFALPSQPFIRAIASALRAAAVPIVVRSSSRFAAGVNDPGASARRGVQLGGAMDPFNDVTLVFPNTEFPPSSSAFAFKLLAALLESLCDSFSRAEGPEMWNGVEGGGMEGSSSPVWDRIRGVALSVPHVMSCLTAAGPSSDGVGEGIAGTREKLLMVGDFGRSMYDAVQHYYDPL